MSGSGDEVRETYRACCRPRTAERLAALGLDRVYVRGQGDYLVDDQGEQILDLVGGYGATMFGHNHPRIVGALVEALGEGRPFAAQASVRGRAAELASRLGARLDADLGARYATFLANTGTEAVEAALKHAMLAHERRTAALGDRFEKASVRARPFDSDGALDRARELFYATLAAHPPGLLAMERAYHGKTLGALSLTHYADYRDAFESALGEVTWVPLGDELMLERAVERHRVSIPWPVVRAGTLHLEERTFSTLAALFLEPIQGEGGVHLCPPRFARRARELADEHEFHLVFDEIQTGMGRTGTFLYAEQLGVQPDVVLLSKSLGGGLAKISCALIREDRYERGFDLVHSSTFAEDDLACSVAIAALGVLERGESPMSRARVQGERIRLGLEAVARRAPDVVSTVRGVGLMIGVELHELTGLGAVAALSQQGMLGYVVAAHLLNEHHIRVMPCISNPNVLRIEPSAFVSTSAVDRFIDAFNSVVRVLRARDAFALLRFLVRSTDERVEPVYSSRPEPPPSMCARRAAFLGYFLDAAQMEEWDPSLGRFSIEEREELIRRVFREVEPMHVESAVIASNHTGERVELRSYGLFVDSTTFHANLRGEGRAVLLERIERALELAREDGCTIAAFGGLTSVVTANCRTLPADRIAVTTGNALTVGACLMAAKAEAEAAGIELSEATAAVVGAGGNIGSVYAELLSDSVRELVLVTRPGREDGVRPVVERILERAYERGRRGGQAGVTARLREHGWIARWMDAHRDATGAELRRVLGHDSPVRVTSDLDELREAALILGASNAPTTLVGVEHIGPGSVVVIDVAVPGDVDPAVRELLPRVHVLTGGAIDLGERNADVTTLAPLPPGHLYACATEAALLALEGRREDHTVGAINASQVHAMLALAERHGVTIATGAHRSALAPLRPLESG
ncbi:MAG: aminotransferase class III-fold pyridoxal phosphate-dependent enzyme [Myxococcales bacterium]|nr:aminotransferase class III-fold pyridoxal phosphate-dependent enzyme [Myxococcales bacterium]